MSENNKDSQNSSANVDVEGEKSKKRSFVSRVGGLKPKDRNNDNKKVEDDEQDAEKEDVAALRIKSLEKQLEVLKAKITTLETEKRYLAAEIDNLVKSHAKDIKKERDYGISSFAKDMIEISENLERAILSGDSSIKSGVEMTLSMLSKVLSSYGVESIQAEGLAFDYNVHQAVKQQESKDVKPGIVLEVVGKGYKIKDRILRPSMVVVSCAPSDSEEGKDD